MYMHYHCYQGLPALEKKTFSNSNYVHLFEYALRRNDKSKLLNFFSHFCCLLQPRIVISGPLCEARRTNLDKYS